MKPYQHVLETEVHHLTAAGFATSVARARYGTSYADKLTGAWPTLVGKQSPQPLVALKRGGQWQRLQEAIGSTASVCFFGDLSAERVNRLSRVKLVNGLELIFEFFELAHAFELGYTGITNVQAEAHDVAWQGWGNGFITPKNLRSKNVLPSPSPPRANALVTSALQGLCQFLLMPAALCSNADSTGRIEC